jgi:glutamine---fructose-6-phosphate transaminase (isomerizing)
VIQQTEQAGSSGAAPGSLMAREIAQQPEVLAGLLDSALAEIRAVAGVLADRAPRFVLLAARGTSDHAALYAKYLFEIRLGLPCGLASPSTVTAYGSRPDLRDVLVISVSQSGGSPDLVEFTSVARTCGATTLAVTNAPGSALAAAAELQLDIQAGPERAVAATKTYGAELLTLYLTVDAMAGGDSATARELPAAAQSLVDRRREIADLAQRYRFASRLVVTGRGYSYPTAREAALKLMETSYVAAHAFSGADLLHGPLAMVDPQYPVLAVVPGGVGAAAMLPVLQRVRERGADVLVLGSEPDSEQPSSHSDGENQGRRVFALPAGLEEEVHPIVDILPLQWLALEVALARGLDPDAPRGLAKVTETW